MNVNAANLPRRLSTTRRAPRWRALLTFAMVSLTGAITAAAASTAQASTTGGQREPAAQPAPAVQPAPAAQPAAGAQAAPTPSAAPSAQPAPGAQAQSAPAAQAPSAPPSTPPAGAKPAITVQQLLARSTAARGGAAKLLAAKTRRESGRISLGEGSEFPLTVEHKRPQRMRMEIELQGGAKLIRAYDGEHGWQLQPQSKAPEPLAGDELHNISTEADFDFAAPLVESYPRAGAELLGQEQVDGRDVYKVKVTLRLGDVFYYDVDSVTYLPSRWEGTRAIGGKPVVFQSTFTDYRDVDGVKYPFLIVSAMKGSTQRQKLTFAKIETNAPLDDSRFTAPPAAAAPAPPAPAPPAAPPAPAAPVPPPNP